MKPILGHFSHTANPNHLPALDGLRGLSVLLVVLGHFGLGYIIPSGLGVTVFFFISGFIITRLLIQESMQHGAVALRAFYARRFFRLAPALIVFVLASNVMMATFGRNLPLDDNLAALFYLANYREFFGGWGATVPENIYNPLAVLWSLAVEEHFYLIYPLLFVFLQPRAGKLLPALLAIVVVVVAWRTHVALDYLGQTGFVDNSRTYKASDTRIDSILYGCMLAILLTVPDHPLRLRIRGFLGSVRSSTLLGFGLSLLLLSLFMRNVFLRESVRYSLQGVALFLIFGVIFRGHGDLPRRLSTWLSARLLVFFGKISYSLYLYHWLIFVALVEWMPRPRIGVLLQTAASREEVVMRLASLAASQLLIGLPLSILLAYASWRWVEQPPRRVGHDWAQRLANRDRLKDRAPSSS